MNSLSTLIVCVLGLAVKATDFTVGDIQIRAVSDTLVQISEDGFKDSVAGIPFHKLRETDSEIVLGNMFYNVKVEKQLKDSAECVAKIRDNRDARNPRNSDNFPTGMKVNDVEECCSFCETDPTCVAFATSVFFGTTDNGKNCWPIKSYSGSYGRNNRSLYEKRKKAAVVVSQIDGTVVYDSTKDEHGIRRDVHIKEVAIL